VRPPRASVVIPALNEERCIGGLLADLTTGRAGRPPGEVLVVDAGSADGTAEVARGFTGVRVLRGEPPPAKGRNLGAAAASGDLLVFLDADVRLEEGFLDRFVEEISRRRLDVACPRYLPPPGASPGVRAAHACFNGLFRLCRRVLPSGAGHCIAVRRQVFLEGGGFDPALKFDDVELVRRLARGRRFGITGQSVLVSDRRYREEGTLRTFLRYLLISLPFALGRFRWANRLDYPFGRHRLS